MKTLHLLIILILVGSSIIVLQSVFAQQTAEEILQERDNAKKTGLAYNGTMLTVIQETNKTEYKTGEKFSVIPHLVNVGNNVATITHGEPLFEIEVLDQNGNTSFIWPEATATIGIDETLNPGMSTTGRWVSGYGGFPQIVLDKPGNYTVYSMANINSEGIPAHTESIWSKPLVITILTENPTTSNISPTITVSTNLQNYTTGDKIIISGHISNLNGKLPLVIKVFDPHHQESISKLFPLWSNESYTWTIPPAAFYYSGNYTVLAQYGENYTTSHFILNFDIDQYLQTLSPLQQHKMFPGTLPQDFHCPTGFQLILKAEDLSPACVHPLTATKLIMWGWALGTTQLEPLIKNMSIVGLQQNYFAGQPINATVVYSGYYWYTEPEVKIFDSNDTQVWFNCPFCYARTEPVPVISGGLFTYHVIEYGTHTLPMINKTGNYTMVASLENKTAEANFTIIASKTPENQNPNQTVSVVSIKGVPPVTPGGPTIQLTLKNTSNKPITSLKATLELNNNYTFDFVNITSSKPLVPNNSTSETQILIGAGFQTDVPHPIIITGIENNVQFTYVENVYIQ